MNSYQEIISSLKAKKVRITSFRENLLDFLSKQTAPVSVPQIEKFFVKGKVNKTTIYRELSFLVREGIAREVKISQQKVYYELAHLPHHHHLVCNECGNISELDCKDLEVPVKDFEAKLSKRGFAVQEHNLEFFGLCKDCN